MLAGILNGVRFVRDSDLSKIGSAVLRGQRSGAGRILFVLAIGRSGTHFLAQCLARHPQIVDLLNGEENPLVFPLIRDAACDPTKQEKLLAKAGRRYRWMSRSAHPKWLVDQSHPNIWFAEHWASLFPDARFVGIIRNPYSVVASSFKHRTAQLWVQQWTQYPIPNQFLGVTAENRDQYASMSLAERSATRWVSHYCRMQELRDELGDRLVVVNYEDVCENPLTQLGKVAELLGVRGEFEMPKVDQSALTKARSLDSDDVEAIKRVLVANDIPDRWLHPVGADPALAS